MDIQLKELAFERRYSKRWFLDISEKKNVFHQLIATKLEHTLTRTPWLRTNNPQITVSICHRLSLL